MKEKFLLYGEAQKRADRWLAVRAWVTVAIILLVTVFACMSSGCATVEQTKLVANVPPPQEVRVPVNVRCVSLGEIPQVPKTRMDPDHQTAEQLIDAAKIDRNNIEAYAVAADALLRACATEALTEEKRK